ncbi:MAG: N-acetylneuraminate synthase family protein [Bacteroidetes bacterium]|nr:N-acetylneuraminate synthase family protein [Bacteroidota bacterium]
MNSKQQIFIIAEIAQAHDGSLGILHSYIDALADSGANAIKFQTHIAEAESSMQEPFRVNFSYEDKTRFDYWKRMEFSQEQWREIKQHCDEKGMEFMSSPFSHKAVELLEDLGVKRYKIGSGEVSNLLMLDRIAETKKPVILSSGLSDWTELDNAVNFLKQQNTEVSVLQCATAYPAPPEKWGLNLIRQLKERYNVPVGFSDHSGDLNACLGATALGAEILEFHAVFDKRMFGPDAGSSLTIDEIKKLVKGVREIEFALLNPVEKVISSEQTELKKMFGKSLALNRELKAGEIIKLEYLESKKPGNMGIPASDYKQVVGRRLKEDKQKWDFLNLGDIE